MREDLKKEIEMPYFKVMPLGNLSALGKAAEMAGHAALFKTDGLAAFRAGFPQKTVFMFSPPFAALIFQISFFEHTAYGIRYGENQSILLKNGMLPSNAFELFNDRIDLHPRSECKRNQAADCLRLGGRGSP